MVHHKAHLLWAVLIFVTLASGWKINESDGGHVNDDSQSLLTTIGHPNGDQIEIGGSYKYHTTPVIVKVRPKRSTGPARNVSVDLTSFNNKHVASSGPSGLPSKKMGFEVTTEEMLTKMGSEFLDRQKQSYFFLDSAQQQALQAKVMEMVQQMQNDNTGNALKFEKVPKKNSWMLQDHDIVTGIEPATLNIERLNDIDDHANQFKFSKVEGIPITLTLYTNVDPTNFQGIPPLLVHLQTDTFQGGRTTSSSTTLSLNVVEIFRNETKVKTARSKLNKAESKLKNFVMSGELSPEDNDNINSETQNLMNELKAELKKQEDLRRDAKNGIVNKEQISQIAKNITATQDKIRMTPEAQSMSLNSSRASKELFNMHKTLLTDKIQFEKEKLSSPEGASGSPDNLMKLEEEEKFIAKEDEVWTARHAIFRANNPQELAAAKENLKNVEREFREMKILRTQQRQNSIATMTTTTTTPTTTTTMQTSPDSDTTQQQAGNPRCRRSTSTVHECDLGEGEASKIFMTRQSSGRTTNKGHGNGAGSGAQEKRHTTSRHVSSRVLNLRNLLAQNGPGLETTRKILSRPDLGSRGQSIGGYGGGLPSKNSKTSSLRPQVGEGGSGNLVALEKTKTHLAAAAPPLAIRQAAAPLRKNSHSGTERPVHRHAAAPTRQPMASSKRHAVLMTALRHSSKKLSLRQPLTVSSAIHPARRRSTPAPPLWKRNSLASPLRRHSGTARSGGTFLAASSAFNKHSSSRGHSGATTPVGVRGSGGGRGRVRGGSTAHGHAPWKKNSATSRGRHGHAAAAVPSVHRNSAAAAPLRQNSVTAVRAKPTRRASVGAQLDRQAAAKLTPRPVAAKPTRRASVGAQMQRRG